MICRSRDLKMESLHLCNGFPWWTDSHSPMKLSLLGGGFCRLETWTSLTCSTFSDLFSDASNLHVEPSALRPQVWGQPRGETPPGEEVVPMSADPEQQQLHAALQPEEEEESRREEDTWGLMIPFPLDVICLWKTYPISFSSLVWNTVCLVFLSRFLSRCSWSSTSWSWRRIKKCVGRSELAGSSLKRTWRRRPTAGANPTWPRSPSAACWSFVAPSRTVNRSHRKMTIKHWNTCSTKQPHHPLLSLLYMSPSSGAILLDLEQNSLPGIAHLVVETMIISDQIRAEDRPSVLRALLLKHRSGTSLVPT